eukprot:Gb_41164 [translate_table: standard]
MTESQKNSGQAGPGLNYINSAIITLYYYPHSRHKTPNLKRNFRRPPGLATTRQAPAQKLLKQDENDAGFMLNWSGSRRVRRRRMTYDRPSTTRVRAGQVCSQIVAACGTGFVLWSLSYPWRNLCAHEVLPMWGLAQWLKGVLNGIA